ncbi:hypothetical protein U1872_08250 [Sphingomonas sp. RB3P16]|uniref:hypothetical protein n=1 Tax=Parasphingomonas frigoris TaxID=3096163 RepID=UPI002FC8DC6A
MSTAVKRYLNVIQRLGDRRILRILNPLLNHNESDHVETGHPTRSAFTGFESIDLFPDTAAWRYEIVLVSIGILLLLGTLASGVGALARDVASLTAGIAFFAALALSHRTARIRQHTLAQRLTAVEQFGATGRFELDLATLRFTGTALFDQIHRSPACGERDWLAFMAARLAPEGQQAISAANRR